MNTIIATFVTHAFAKQAEEDLRKAGFDVVNVDVKVIPETIKNASKSLPKEPGLVSSDDGNNTAIHRETTSTEDRLVSETLNANGVARLTLEADSQRDKAMEIITKHGGVMENERAEIAQAVQDDLQNS